MNHGAELMQYPDAASSFDWSSVEFRFPPDASTPLPVRGKRTLPRVQHRFGGESAGAAEVRVERLLEVRRAFERAWQSYRRLAWKKDALLPISARARNQFCGWAAALVDSLDTLWIMGFRDKFDEAVAAVAEIDFGHSTSLRVNTFETDIRYLGGLLAAYDLSGREVLLAKAVELGDLLYAGFNTQSGMPADFISFGRAKAGTGLAVESTVVSAAPGTLSLEMTRLSQLTGDAKYYSAVSGVMSRTFLDTVDRHFLFRPMVPGGEDILMPGNVNLDRRSNEPVLDPETEHLACFVGGMFGLAGKLLQMPADIETGIKLTNGCVFAYRAFPTGMMPERLDMAPCKDRSSCPWDEDYWIQEREKRPEWREHLPKGFTTAKDPRYILRPEAIESVFYMYRITGRSEFQDVAWDMFTAISNGTRTEYANAAVLDVTKGEYPLPREDYMESFWLAETLKYFYLVFSTPDIISLDDYVLNTEAHPFKLEK